MAVQGGREGAKRRRRRGELPPAPVPRALGLHAAGALEPPGAPRGAPRRARRAEAPGRFLRRPPLSWFDIEPFSDFSAI